MKKLIMMLTFLVASAFAVAPVSYAGDHGHDSRSNASEKRSDHGSSDKRDAKKEHDDHGNKHGKEHKAH